jgi:putative solute:sodium symporter small subunit
LRPAGTLPTTSDPTLSASGRDRERVVDPQQPYALADEASTGDLGDDVASDVAATFVTQRRIALGTFAVFLVVTFAVPVLALAVPWWTRSRAVGGMSPAFVMVAIGLYVIFLAIALVAARLADAAEDRMPGADDLR